MILKPVAFVERGQTLSPKGRKKIKEALEAYKKGKVSKVYDNVEEMIKDLNS